MQSHRLERSAPHRLVCLRSHEPKQLTAMGTHRKWNHQTRKWLKNCKIHANRILRRRLRPPGTEATQNDRPKQN